MADPAAASAGGPPTVPPVGLTPVRIVVGRCGKPHGVNGLVTVEVRTDEPERRFAAGARFDTDAADLVVDTVHWHGARLLLGFAGIGDRAAAERLRDTLLEVEVDPRDRPADDEYYDFQLVGLRVVDPANRTVGRVREVVHLPGQDLLAVTLAPDPDPGADTRDADTRDAEKLVPFVSALVPTVDLDAGLLVVDAPDGLLDDDTVVDDAQREAGGTDAH